MKEQLATTLENSKNYTLKVAAAMPDADYSFLPAGTNWKFSELMEHVAYGIHWWENNFIKGTETGWNPPPTKSSKKQIINHLEKSFQALKETIASHKLDEKAVNGFHATLDHITHHRGQAVLYLRQKGIQPPDYNY
jgi:uncharacterized damage-inducible protein DinB